MMIDIRQVGLIGGACVFLTALTAGVILTSLMCRISWRWKLLDKPEGFLKCHSKPTATVGGVPVLIAAACGFGVLQLFRYRLEGPAMSWLTLNPSHITYLAAAMTMLCVGVTDDIRGVMPKTKLMFQILSALVIVGGGLLIRRCEFFDVFGIPLGPLAVPFTVFWLVGSCNAFNFIDGMDGLAAGIGAVISILLAVLALMNGSFQAAMIALALAGALSAILLFNIRPAVIFLGDSGSQLIGLALGALAIKAATSNGSFALPSAGLVLSVPVIDSVLSIVRRCSRSEGLAQGDRKHIHHCLRELGFSVNQVSLALCAVVGLTGCMGLVCLRAKGVQVGSAALMFVLLELYMGIRLGCANWPDVWHRISSAFGRLNVSEPQVRAAGRRAAEIEVLWNQMKPLFEEMQLDRAVLTLEGVSADGQTDRQTYHWVRSEELIAELLDSRWTRRFPLGEDDARMATLQLESSKEQWRDEARVDKLLREISANMRRVKHLEPQHDRAGGVYTKSVG